jgi:2-C-methyl-D-erythritol 4-phosphate cytidylyltransferase
LYSSTKAAIVNLTQALAEELKDKDIKINCINPERTQTPMRVKNFGYEDPKTLLDSKKVATVSLNTLLSNLTGQIVDVKVGKV